MICLRLPDFEGKLSEVVFYGREYRLHSQNDVRFKEKNAPLFLQ